MDNSRTDRERELAQVRQCLNIITYKPDGHPYRNPSEARTRPNQRLVEVFGIQNAFTDTNPKKHGEFVRLSIARMKAACKITSTNDKGDWTHLRERAISYTKEHLQRSSSSSHQKGHTLNINLTELVQCITLKTSLLYLFTDADTASKLHNTTQDIPHITDQINTLWQASKNPSAQRPQWKNQHALHAALRRVTDTCSSIDMPGSYIQDTSSSGTEPTVAAENPLNLILPAYETMWRVVLRCLLEVRYRGGAGGPESAGWRHVLSDFLADLSDPECMPDAFHRQSCVSGVRPVDVAKEALRLYPPSRHVYREFDGEVVCADIEACQRGGLLGGSDPLVFRPERWGDICAEERARGGVGGVGDAVKALKSGELELGFMPFATYCPADKKETRAFAMKMLVMLVAVLCDGLGDEWELMDAGSLPERGVPLESDRAAYGALELRRL